MKTQFSRRELYALGEPLGESATRVVAGRRIYGGGGGILGGVGDTISNAFGGGGGGGSTPPNQGGSFSNTSPAPQSNPTVSPMTQSDTQQGIAGYAQPYVNTMLGATMQNLFDYDASGNATGMKQYTPYSYNPADYVAGFSPLQQQAQQGVANMQMPGQFGQATSATQDAINRAQNAQYNPQTGGYGRVNTQQFTGNQVGQYMNPYLQNALQPQLQEMQRQYDITGAREMGNATKQGAFGGSRQALMQAENQRNKNMAMNQAIGQGYNTAYQNAANQFNTSQGQNITAQTANQQARQAAQNLAANQQQFGANYGLANLQQQLAGANQLGNLGTSQLGAQQNIYGLQNALGQQQQQQQQNIINQGVQNYQTAQQYPMQQLAQMKGMLSGLPIGTTSTQGYQAAPTNLQNMLALGMGGAGISKLMGGGSGGSGGGFDVSGALNSGAGLLGQAGNAIGGGLSSLWNGVSGLFNEGGEVKSYKEGGVTSEENVASIANFLPTAQLPRSFQAAQGRGDVDAENALQKEMAERASLERGLGGAFNQLPQTSQQNVIRAAGGGVVAFAKGGLQDTLAQMTELGNQDTSATPEETVQGIQALAPQIQSLYGPSKTAGFSEELAKERADLKSGKNMNQGYGLGLLKAAQAVLKPGGAMRGLGDAGAAFGEEVIKMEKENREADRLLRQSQITLAAADQARADGQIGKAQDLWKQGQDAKAKALDRKIGVAEKKATIQGGIEQAQIHSAATMAGINKPTDLDKQANTIYASMVAADKTIEQDPATKAAAMAEARKQAADQLGRYPGSARVEAAEGKDRAKAAGDVAIMKRADKQWKAANAAGDQAAMDARVLQMIDEQMGKVGGATKGGAPAAPAQQQRAQTPDLNTWMAAARKANPGVSDAELKAYYSSNYK